MPKKYQCVVCGWEGQPKQARKVKFPGMTFLVCKCGGRLKERQEWLDWKQRSVSSVIDAKQAIEFLEEESKFWNHIKATAPEPEDAEAYCNRYTAIISLIESLSAKAELGEAAEKEFIETAKEWACQGEYKSKHCIVDADSFHCKCSEFCRLRAGRE
jgi:hypothetical protein